MYKIRKYHFNIRKVHIGRQVRKAPELNALDIHGICLPTKKDAILNWASMQYALEPNYQDDYNDQIMNSPQYRELISTNQRISESKSTQKKQLLRVKYVLEQEMEMIEENIQKQKNEKNRLLGLRDKVNVQVQNLNNQLTETREKNYNLRWQICQERGGNFININGYSFLESNQMTVQQMLQTGRYQHGFTQQEINNFHKTQYKNINNQQEICCICFQKIILGQNVVIFKCKHIHHFQCIQDWMLKQRKCPICKQIITVS